MFKILRNSAKKLLLTGAVTVLVSAAATSVYANRLIDLGGGYVLSCGSSAGNYIIDNNNGDYLHGGIWQWVADTWCANV